MSFKTNSLVVLLALILALPATAESLKIATPPSLVSSPAPITLAATAPDEPEERGEVQAHAHAATPASQAAEHASARPVQGSAAQVSSLEALEWIVQAVTCHEARACQTQTKGIALNFSMPY